MTEQEFRRRRDFEDSGGWEHCSPLLVVPVGLLLAVLCILGEAWLAGLW